MLKVISSKREWDLALSGFPEMSVLGSSEYMFAAAPLEQGGSAMLAVYEVENARLIHPFVRRSIPGQDNLYDLISVFDFGGFWLKNKSSMDDQNIVHGFEAAFEIWCRDNGIVCEFVRIHPFAPFNTQLLNAYEVDVFCENVMIDLTVGHDKIFQNYSTSRQKQVRQGRDKYQLVPEEVYDSKLFTEVFHDNLRRINSSGFYFFPQKFIERISPISRMFFARTPDGEICAAHLYILDGPVVFAYLCHGVADHHHLRPNDFLYDHAIRLFSQGNYKYLHFGGGVESLLTYKKSFSPCRVKYRIARRIFNNTIYRQLSDGKEPTEPSTFFPQYRLKNTLTQ